ncbi:lysosomal alpha-glucosidase [Trichonephila clavata]|uniref:Lysosomal alpha-glucosidase n=1 Tax=Trichonephila clavata TaxID=2740835 RepID=A0A8X6FYG5_TRICU|nr:lysosomal alpha-glucosidase [Trichonephila clavata]
MKKHEYDLFYLIRDQKRKNKPSVLGLFLLMGFILCFLAFATRSNRFSIVLFNVSTETESEYSPVCAGISDLDKFDCHPDDNVSEQSCLQRGCCYQAKNIKNTAVPLNVPYCYYPSNYNGYSIGNIVQDGRQITADLKRSTSSGFPNDVLSLHLIITFIDDSILRIKIIDPNTKRYEVPIPINDALKELYGPNYNVKIDSKNGNLLITRKVNGVVIFRTNLSQLVYSDQFLQLSSYLPSPYIYGIGEHYGSFLRSVNWTKFTVFNSDKEPEPNYPLYGSQPFYLSLEEDGKANGVFLFNSNAMDVILQPTPAITFRPIGGVLDLFIMLGPYPDSVIQQYTDIVGRPSMPPFWGLGFHLCRYGYDTLNNTKETLQRNLDAGIPLDVQWNDIDYMDKLKDFTYDKDKFAGLPEFVKDLHNKGMHYVIMTDPGISASEKPGTYPPFDDGVKDDIFLKNPNGSLFLAKVWTDGGTVFPDFSHPNASSYWLKQLANFHAEVEYDGLWIDMNEPSNVIDGGLDGCIKSSFEDPPYLPNSPVTLHHRTACMTSKHYSTIHYNEHNLMGYREAAASNQAMKSIRQKRPFVISRATFSGQGVHSGHWSGDISSTWEDMRYTIPSMLSFNLYGIPFVGSDICGFNFNTSVTLCARWQSLGAFYPFSRNHNDASAMDQDPVTLGPIVVNATIKSLSIRYLLLPYLYTLFARSHRFGETVARPLFFEFQWDKNTYSIDEQFMWGSGLMITPVLYPDSTSVNVYFPKGLWYSVDGKLTNSSGEKILVDVPLTDVFIAIRGGNVLPAKFFSLNTAASRLQPFMLIVALDENLRATGELYWDDGDSLDTFEEKRFSLVEFYVYNNTLTSALTYGGYDGPMNVTGILILGLSKGPSEVSVNGLNCITQPPKKEQLQMGTLFDHLKASMKVLDEITSNDLTCFYDFVQPNALEIGVKGVNLRSDLTVTWK